MVNRVLLSSESVLPNFSLTLPLHSRSFDAIRLCHSTLLPDLNTFLCSLDTLILSFSLHAKCLTTTSDPN